MREKAGTTAGATTPAPSARFGRAVDPGCTVVVIGGSGRTGRAVTAALSRRGVAVRILSRSPDRTSGAFACDMPETAVEVLGADLEDEGSVVAAVRGCAAAYVIPPRLHPHEDALSAAALQALERGGVERVVLHSVLHPYVPTVPHHLRKARAEAGLRSSWTEWTCLQPCTYAQNFPPKLFLDGSTVVLPSAWSPDAPPMTPVDLDDVAEAAAVVLTEAGHAFATYELCGPEVLGHHEIAAAFAGVLGRPVEARQVTLDQVVSLRRPLRHLADFAAYHSHYDEHGFVGNPRVLAMLLERTPTRLVDVIRREIGSLDL